MEGVPFEEVESWFPAMLPLVFLKSDPKIWNHLTTVHVHWN